MRRVRLTLVVLACLACAASPIARAQTIDTEDGRSASDDGYRPFLLSLGVGPSILFSDTIRGPFDPSTGSSLSLGTGTGFMTALDIGGHFGRVDEHPGFFLAASTAWQTAPGFSLRGGARLGFDIQVARFEEADVTLLVTPSIMAGVALVGGAQGIGGPWFMAALDVDTDFRVVLLDGRLGLWVRPVSSDWQFAQFFTWRWNLLIGAEVRL